MVYPLSKREARLVAWTGRCLTALAVTAVVAMAMISLAV